MARPNSAVIYLPAVDRDRFLRSAANQIDALRSECEAQGHPLLAALLAIAKGEAEDDLHTTMRDRQRSDPDESDDPATMRMARKLAPDFEDAAG